MSHATKKFLAAMGRANPTARDGLALPPAPSAQWRQYAKEIAPGWYRGGFLDLFGDGVQRFHSCLDAWAFLLPAGATFAPLGRNAHGSILVLQDGDSDVGGQIGVLDTTVAQYATSPGWLFPTLFSQLLPDGVLDRFCDDRLFKKWRAAASRARVALEGDLVLGLRTPLPLGGTMTADNLVVADLFDYYDATADAYRRARSRR